MADTTKIVPVTAGLIALGITAALAWALMTGPSPDTKVANQETDNADSPNGASFFLTDKIAFAPIQVRADDMAAARARMPGSAGAAPRNINAVRAAQQKLGRQERTGATTAAQRDAQHKFTLQLTNVLAIDGRAGLQALESALWKDFEAALRALPDAKQEIATLADTTGGDFDQALDTLGTFLRLGPTLGLIGPRGTVRPEDWPVIRLAFRVRLFGSLAGSATPGELLAPAETRAFYLWRLHNAPIKDPQMRMRWANRMPSYVPGYPHAAAQVVVLAQAGDVSGANAQLIRAREEEPELTPVYDAWLGLLPPSKNP